MTHRTEPEAFVRVDPRMRFGRPNVAGVPVDSLTENIWAGDSVQFVADGYGLTVPQVLVACWYQARHGTRTWRSRWKDWVKEAEYFLWHNHPEQVADPPSKSSHG